MLSCTDIHFVLPDLKPKRTRYEFVNYKLWDKQLLIHIVGKSTPRFTKSPSLVLIRLVLTQIQRIKNVKTNKEMYSHPDVVFINFDIFKWLYLAYYWVYFHQTLGFYKAWSALGCHNLLASYLVLRHLKSSNGSLIIHKKANSLAHTCKFQSTSYGQEVAIVRIRINWG